MSKAKKRFVIIDIDGYQALYVDGVFYESYSKLGEGHGLVWYLQKTLPKFNGSLHEVVELYLDDDVLESCDYDFPEKLESINLDSYDISRINNL